MRGLVGWAACRIRVPSHSARRRARRTGDRPAAAHRRSTGAAPARPRPPPPSADPPAPADPAARAAALVATLADEDLVGQVLMPYAYGDSATEVSAGSAAGNRALAGVDTPAEMSASTGWAA